MSEIAIQIKSVSKYFILPHQRASTLKSIFVNPFTKYENEKQLALKEVSFDVKKGEFFGIVGRNGSGKSTLLKCIAGVYTPDKGSINVEGSLVPFIELGVGFNPELSGRDNVFLNGALLGFNRPQIDLWIKNSRTTRLVCKFVWLSQSPSKPKAIYCCWTKFWLLATPNSSKSVLTILSA